MVFSNSTLPGEIPPPPPDSNGSRCHLLGTTGIIVQLIMGVLVLASLVVKRHLEKRKRPWRIWMWDVGKQMTGQAVVHGLNLLISNVVAGAAESNPCSLYFLNVLLDTTVGVLIFYVFLKAITWILAAWLGKEGFVSGQYGNPPRPLFWWRQLTPYLISMVAMKLLVVLPLTLPYISTALLRMGHYLLDYLNPKLQIVFVMALFPVVMNIIQICIFDQIIKAGKTLGDDGEEEGAEEGDRRYRPLPSGDIEASSGDLRRRNSGSKGEMSRDGSMDGGSKSASRHRGVLSTPIPSSPLLAPSTSGSRNDYGSAHSSPRLDHSGSGSFWRTMLDGKSQTSAPPASLPISSSPQDSHLSTTTGARHDWRSGAPSPESYRPESSHDEQVTRLDLSSEHEHDGRSRPSLELLTHFGHVSRLSDDMGREARRQLSPRTKASMSNLAGEGLGLGDIPK